MQQMYLVLVFLCFSRFSSSPFFFQNEKRGGLVHRLSASSKGRPAAFIKLLADLRCGGEDFLPNAECFLGPKGSGPRMPVINGYDMINNS